MTTGPTLLVGGDDPLSTRLAGELEARRVSGDLADQDLDDVGTAIYLAGFRRSGSGRPDSEDAQTVLRTLAEARVPRVIVVSSAAVWEPSHRHLGHVAEEPLPPCREDLPVVEAWRDLEARAHRFLGERTGTVLTLLRPAPTPVPGGEDFWSRFLAGESGGPLPGYDPSIQLLDPQDLAEALRRARTASPAPAGPVHVAPAGVIPVKKALELAGVSPQPRPALLMGEARRLRKLHKRYVRYPWTVSADRAREELRFVPRYDSAATVRRFAGRPEAATEPGRFDDFGMDPTYIDAYGRTLFRFLHDRYWRVELDGLEHVPRLGRVVLTGVHRGFMPFDGVMALHAIRRETGRIVRFLIHPTLVKFPFLANFMTRLGGIHACRENAARVLEDDQILGIFPEGIRGAFSLYRAAYELKKFGRDEFVKMALRHRAPIVPFVTVGSAEIYPVWKKLYWRWWRKWSEWPCLPLGPNFPWIGIPLPSKWHTRFLEPLHVEDRYGPEAADDPRVVRALSLEVQDRMKGALDEILQRRPSIFYGDVF